MYLERFMRVRLPVAEIDKNYKTNKKKIYKLDAQKHSQSGQDGRVFGRGILRSRKI